MAKVKLGSFKCSKCNRTFSMAAHLARHQNTMHAGRAKQKRVKTKGATKLAARRPVRKSVKRAGQARPATGVGQAPLLRQMQIYRDELVAQRARVVVEIDAIDQALAALGAAARTPASRSARGRRVSPARPGSLKSYVERVLRSRGGAMAVKDVTAAVLRAGFKSKNKTLGKSVGIAMTQMPNVAKVSHGVFRLK
jgi:hypothetical protein